MRVKYLAELEQKTGFQITSPMFFLLLHFSSYISWAFATKGLDKSIRLGPYPQSYKSNLHEGNERAAMITQVTLTKGFQRRKRVRQLGSIGMDPLRRAARASGRM